MAKFNLHCFGFCLLFFICFYGNGGQITPKTIALQDTSKVADVIRIALVVDYPERNNIMFPDTNYKHPNLEIRSKEYFSTTRIDSVTLRDSAIYSVQSFTTKSVLKISFPIFLLTTYDTIDFSSDTILVKIKPLISGANKTFLFHSYASFIKPNLPIHPYIWIGIILCGILVLALTIWLTYKPILKKYKIYTLKKSFDRLQIVFTNVHKTNINDKNAIHLLQNWKRFLDKTNNKEHESFTLKEIIKSIDNQYIGYSLTNFEKALYSNNEIEESDILALRTYAQDQLEIKINEIKLS